MTQAFHGNPHIMPKIVGYYFVMCKRMNFSDIVLYQRGIFIRRYICIIYFLLSVMEGCKIVLYIDERIRGVLS